MSAAARSAGRTRRAAWLLLLALSPLFLRAFADPDIWFHLVIGREILARGGLPPTEFYIFPALGEPALFTAAGYGLLQYLLQLAAGLPALVAFNALLLAGTLGLLAHAALVREDGLPLGLLALALAIAYVGLNPRYLYRPETLLYLALGAELVLLERWRLARRARLLWPLPLIAVALANLHSTAIFVSLVLGAYLAGALLESLRAPACGAPWRAAGLGAGLAMLGLCLLAPLANPYGAEQLLLLAAGFAGEGNALVEYLPIHRTEYLPHFALLVAAALAGMGLAGRARACDLLMLGGFGLLAAISARNLGLFAIATLLPFAEGLATLEQRLGKARRRTLRRGALAAALGVFALATVTEDTWGTGVDASGLPVQGAHALGSMLAGGNLFSFFHFGGYLAWTLGPEFRVAIDGHFVRPSAAHGLHNAFFRADPGWQAIAREHRAVAILTPATLDYSGMLIPLVAELAADPGWRLVVAEPGGLTFLPAGLAPELATLDKRLVWWQVIEEAQRTLDRYPEQPGALEAIARASAALQTR